jgi:HigB_toxin, RelE-like toxic component of a toxin-antitoxin system
MSWYRVAQSEDFSSFADLRLTFARADRVKGLTVFNMAGNSYRLIAAIPHRLRTTKPDFRRSERKARDQQGIGQGAGEAV